MKAIPLTLALAALAPQLAYAVDGCFWNHKNGLSDGPLIFKQNFGTVYVPRDAPLGAIIGTAQIQSFDRQIGSNAMLACFNELDQRPLILQASAAMGLAAPPSNLPPPIAPDRLLKTNIDGVAAQFEYLNPFNQARAIRTLDGRPPMPPFQAQLLLNPFQWEYSSSTSLLTLIKTDTLQPGPNLIDTKLFSGTMTDIPGEAMSYSITGTVIQAQCELGASVPSSVELGEWSTSDFTGPGYTTVATKFSIALANCQDDPANGATEVYLQFDPQRGSLTIDRDKGIFSLMTGSTAKGIAMQVLQSDGSPMMLNDIVHMQRLPVSGATQLDFAVRLYQTGTASEVVAGIALGALGFTISYM
ncbi:fimbrial protein [Pseudomonas sp. KNUC1026]|uniref:fimbrial protein n=1 Tax=Pseudomonas sp. KNUC1026 TaxID=2893890 RepID=UPI001F2D166F|nr:fimbrial protein [Pseudomonas sp. KNUC1026]UFH48290.1 type 1 fimbrial protein [Pseudomonas sp. KNUC1026]